MNLIGLYTPDKVSFPNYALMKIAKYHRGLGDTAILMDEPEDGIFDKAYCSSVFNYSDKAKIPSSWETGGSGYSLSSALPDGIESLEPDYTLYPEMTHALGFLTRGCIRHCDFCIVPEKEGIIRPYRDVITVAQGRKDMVLCDNNVLAHPHGIQQMEIIADKGLKVDFNQGLDAQLITPEIAHLASRIKWLSPIRLACDSDYAVDGVIKAIQLLRWYNVTPRNYLVYVLAKDVDSVMPRLRVLKGMKVMPFLQPLRDKKNTPVSSELRHLARWVNAGGGRAFNSCSWEDYCRGCGDRI